MLARKNRLALAGTSAVLVAGLAGPGTTLLVKGLWTSGLPPTWISTWSAPAWIGVYEAEYDPLPASVTGRPSGLAPVTVTLIWPAAPSTGLPNSSTSVIEIVVTAPAIPSGTDAELRSSEGGPGATTMGPEVAGEKPSAAKIRVRVPGSPRMARSVK